MCVCVAVVLVNVHLCRSLKHFNYRPSRVVLVIESSRNGFVTTAWLFLNALMSVCTDNTLHKDHVPKKQTITCSVRSRMISIRRSKVATESLKLSRHLYEPYGAHTLFF